MKAMPDSSAITSAGLHVLAELISHDKSNAIMNQLQKAMCECSRYIEE